MSRHFGSTMTVKNGVVCNPSLELMDYAREAGLRALNIDERKFTPVGLGAFAMMVESPEGQVAIEVKVTPKKCHPGYGDEYHSERMKGYDIGEMARKWEQAKSWRVDSGRDRMRSLERKIAELETEHARLAKLFR